MNKRDKMQRAINTLPLPNEVHDLFLEYFVNLDCRDKAIQSFWKAKRAVMYGKQAEEAKLKAFGIVRDLCPKEYREKILEYARETKTLSVKPEPDK